MNKITKAILPVGGMGTRFLPATKSIPKELLPIIDKPLIQYAVEEAIEAGIDTLIFITSASKHAISDHFDPMPDLRERFISQEKHHLVEKLDTLPLNVQRVFIPQGQPLGLGHAVLQAENMISPEEYFAVLLADDFIQSNRNPLQRLIDVATVQDVAAISVEKVPNEKVSSYGVIDPANWSSDVVQVKAIVEKPEMNKAPSNYGVIGRYVLPHSVFGHLRQVRMDRNDEIQLTDALQQLCQNDALSAVKLTGQRFDCGSQSGFVMANLHVAMQDPKMALQIKSQLLS